MGKKKKVVELQEMNVILRIPENATALELRAKIFDEGGKVMTVQSELSVQDIFKARQDFLDNVESGDDYDATYALSEETRTARKRPVEDNGR